MLRPKGSYMDWHVEIISFESIRHFPKTLKSILSCSLFKAKSLCGFLTFLKHSNKKKKNKKTIRTKTKPSTKESRVKTLSIPPQHTWGIASFLWEGQSGQEADNRCGNYPHNRHRATASRHPLLDHTSDKQMSPPTSERETKQQGSQHITTEHMEYDKINHILAPENSQWIKSTMKCNYRPVLLLDNFLLSTYTLRVADVASEPHSHFAKRSVWSILLLVFIFFPILFPRFFFLHLWLYYDTRRRQLGTWHTTISLTLLRVQRLHFDCGLTWSWRNILLDSYSLRQLI